MNNRDLKVLIGELRLKAGAAFKIELSKSKKEVLYIEQFGKVIFLKQD